MQAYKNDIAAGFGAAFIISPFINIIDSIVTSIQSGKYKMGSAIRYYVAEPFSKPLFHFSQRTFLWSYTVYALTYTSNNLIDTYCASHNINNFFPKLVGVSLVNILSSLAKDATFARSFGVKLPERVHLHSYICWVGRDVVAMTNAFIIPERIHYLLNKRNSKVSFEKVQMSVPYLNLIMTPPFNLLGLDIYNYKKSRALDRAKRVAAGYPKVVPLAFTRMGLAYGVGGVSNKNLKDMLNESSNRMLSIRS